MKGETVFYYRDGVVNYESAEPAIVIDHNREGDIVKLAVLSSQEIKDVRYFEHSHFEMFPSHKFEEGVFGPVTKPRNRKKQRMLNIQSIDTRILNLSAAGLTPEQIVEKLKDEKVEITLTQVRSILGDVVKAG